MAGALKWFMLSGAALGLGIGWAYFQEQISRIHNRAPIATSLGAAFGAIGLASVFASAIKESVFITVAISIATLMWVLSANFSGVEAYLSSNWKLAFLMPYLLGAAASGFSKAGLHHKLLGWSFFAVAVLIGTKPLMPDLNGVKEYFTPINLEVTVTPSGSETIEIPGGAVMWVTPRYGPYVFSLKYRHTGEDVPGYGCSDEPHAAQNKINVPVNVYFQSCGNQITHISVSIRHF